VDVARVAAGDVELLVAKGGQVAEDLVPASRLDDEVEVAGGSRDAIGVEPEGAHDAVAKAPTLEEAGELS
jgi:hypothetical protein